ncbi:MAG: endonuclease domain-containing protein [Dehalococcoidia bacterium]|nr:endonuclease domain-containing protein [Dehalococcoidia bacterium]
MTTAKARSLRRNLTPAERSLWNHLKARQASGFKFRRQEPIGDYIADFVYFEAEPVIEVDGGQHSEQTDYDAARSEWLGSQGFRVLRFWNNEVLQNLEGVQSVIAHALETTPHLNPLPQREKRLVTRRRP